MRLRQFMNCYRSAVADQVPEWMPNGSLDRQIAEARKHMGEERWKQLNEEWEA